MVDHNTKIFEKLDALAAQATETGTHVATMREVQKGIASDLKTSGESLIKLQTTVDNHEGRLATAETKVDSLRMNGIKMAAAILIIGGGGTGVFQLVKLLIGA